MFYTNLNGKQVALKDINDLKESIEKAKKMLEIQEKDLTKAPPSLKEQAIKFWRHRLAELKRIETAINSETQPTICALYKNGVIVYSSRITNTEGLLKVTHIYPKSDYQKFKEDNKERLSELFDIHPDTD